MIQVILCLSEPRSDVRSSELRAFMARCQPELLTAGLLDPGLDS